MFSIILAAGWPIWPLIASSVVALAIVIERYFSLTDAKIAPASLTKAVIDNLHQGIPPPDAIAQLERNSLLGQVLASGLYTRSQDALATEADVRAALAAPIPHARHPPMPHLCSPSPQDATWHPLTPPRPARSTRSRGTCSTRGRRRWQTRPEAPGAQTGS